MEQPSDLLKARTEAALLLRLDPSNLSPSDTLRCDLIASLRLVVDDASTSVLDGRAPDLARLLTATESLIRLLPSEPPKPASNREDPRQLMWETYLGMRRRGDLAGDENSFDFQRRRRFELEAEVAALKNEIEQLKAQLAEALSAPTLVATVPPDNVVPLRSSPNPPPAAPAKPFVNGLSDVAARYSAPEEPWREHLNANYDPWADNR